MKTDKPAILVTGGAGYIGSHVAYSLLDQSESVVILDDLSEGSLSLVPNAATFIRGDIHDEPLIGKLVAEHGIDTVMHFASFVKVDESVREPEKYETNNVGGTQALVRASKKAGA